VLSLKCYWRQLLMVGWSMLLSTSSFSIEHYLAQCFSDQHYSSAQLQYGLTQNHVAALHIALQQLPVGSPKWLNYSAILAKQQADSAVQLAQYFQRNNDDRAAILWFKQAIRLQYLPAYIALATFYIATEQTEAAWQVLEQAIDLPVESYLMKVRLAVKLAKLNYLSEQVSRLAQTEQGQALLAKLYRYQVLAKPTPVVESVSCSNSLQIFATTVDDLERLEALIAQVEHHAPANQFCFAIPRFRPLSELACQASSHSAIRCDERRWQTLATQLKSRYLGVLLPQGGANVHYGILYLDRQDDAHVLQHELSHLLGLVDEYALPRQHSFCAQYSITAASNVVSFPRDYLFSSRAQLLQQLPWRSLIKASTPLAHQVNGQWQLGTPDAFLHEVGLFAADTCARNLTSAFKPLAEPSMLLHHELSFSTVYRQISTHTSEQLKMPSFHYNLAIAEFAEQNEVMGTYWLNFAAAQEQDTSRQQRVIQLDF
jgi:hypothetical protein